METTTKEREMPGWKTTLKLHRNEIAEILDALAEVRDAYGEPAGELEDRLSNLLHKNDRIIAERKAARA